MKAIITLPVLFSQNFQGPFIEHEPKQRAIMFPPALPVAEDGHRLAAEVPQQMVEMNRGDGDLMTIMRDVLALTKINYNACDFASGLPVTLKFADRVGEILTASPRGLEAPPMPFRFYI